MASAGSTFRRSIRRPPTTAWREGLDGEGVRQFYGRLAFKGLTVTGAYGTRQRDVPTASFGTLFNEQDPREQTTDRHALVDARVRALVRRHARDVPRLLRSVLLRRDLSVRRRAGRHADASSGTTAASGRGGASAAGVTRAFRGRQTVRAGVEFIDNVHQDQIATLCRCRRSPLLDSRHSSMQHAVYVQDEIKLGRWLIVNAGLRYDGYEQFARVTPRAALIVLPSSTQSLKYLYGSAFRAPNAFELNTVYFGEQVTRCARSRSTRTSSCGNAISTTGCARPCRRTGTRPTG